VDVSLTRPPSIRTGGGSVRTRGRASQDVIPVALVAATAAEARRAAAALGSRASSFHFRPASLSEYLASAEAPARVILCARQPRGLAFLRRAAARLLWPAPPEDIDSAIGGLRDSHGEPSASTSVSARRRTHRVRVALLLEGSVDGPRTRAALGSDGPRDWIVESPRHVRVSDRGLASLARAGVRWSALRPVELLALYVPESVARALGRRPWLPPRTPMWIIERHARRAPR
jgi:hypothetical protein